MQEVLADNETVFTCSAEGPVEWRFYYNTTMSVTLANCEKTCLPVHTFGIFNAEVINAQTTAMIIKVVDHTKFYDNIHLISGSLWCSRKSRHGMPSSCGLNFVCKYTYTLSLPHTCAHMDARTDRNNQTSILKETNMSIFLIWSVVCDALMNM